MNAVAPKITSSGVSAITKQINENFTEAVSTALLTKLTEIGIKIEEQLPTIRKIENGIFTLEKRLPEIRAAGQKVLELEKKLPAIIHPFTLNPRSSLREAGAICFLYKKY